jgi:hypothetical protein
VEDESVPDSEIADSQLLNDLKKCMRKAEDDDARAECQAAFEAGGGVATADGGKVFSAPGGSEAFVTNGGKVF